MSEATIALARNLNAGKGTLFNGLNTNVERLAEGLGVQVVATLARDGRDVDQVGTAIAQALGAQKGTLQ